MKKQLKIAAIAFVLAVTASTSFAVDLSPLFSAGGGGVFGATQSFFNLALANATFSATENVALIEQSGSAPSEAYIDQLGNSGNLAAIIQLQTGGVGNYAHIEQSGGSDNFAVITQSGTFSNAAAIVQLGTSSRAAINQQ